MNDAIREEVRLADILTLAPVTGVRQAQEGRGTPVRWVATGLVSGGQKVLREMPAESTYASARDRLARDGDLLLVCRGVERYQGVPCSIVRTPEPVAFAESLVRLTIDSQRVESAYLRAYLSSRIAADSLVAASSGTTISFLSPSALREVMVPLPPLERQRAIVAALDDLDAELSRLKSTVQLFADVIDTATVGLLSGALVPNGGTDGRRSLANEHGALTAVEGRNETGVNA